MLRIRPAIFVATLLAVSTHAVAQEPEPIFQQVPAVLYETYRGTTSNFDDYFRMLVQKYAGTDGYGWAVYRENGKVAYRITALPEGLASVLPVQQARGASFQEFDENQLALWSQSWATRHAAMYNAAPDLSVVPAGFTVDDIRAQPYHRVIVYHLKWDQAGAFREALARRSELDRAAGIENFVLTVWNGGFGTEGQTVMLRVSAESREADAGPNRAARMAKRQPYWEEWVALTRTMADAAWAMDVHDEWRQNDLSWTPAN